VTVRRRRGLVQAWVGSPAEPGGVGLRRAQRAHSGLSQQGEMCAGLAVAGVSAFPACNGAGRVCLTVL